MHYLIDGYNLMHAAGLMKARFGPGGLEKARRALTGVLAGSLGDEAIHTTIVFDARPVPSDAQSQAESPEMHGIHVEFASGEEGADARIEQLIHRESTPKRLTVVSSDARIRAAAKRRGAKPIDSERFWEQLLRDRRPTKNRPAGNQPEKPGGRGARESEFWLHEFEDLISDAELRELAGPFADEKQDS